MSGHDDFDRAQEAHDALGPDEDDQPSLMVEPRCWCGRRLDDRGFCPFHGRFVPEEEP